MPQPTPAEAEFRSYLESAADDHKWPLPISGIVATAWALLAEPLRAQLTAATSLAASAEQELARWKARAEELEEVLKEIPDLLARRNDWKPGCETHTALKAAENVIREIVTAALT